jgi:hypothetical protein
LSSGFLSNLLSDDRCWQVFIYLLEVLIHENAWISGQKLQDKIFHFGMQ